MPCRIWISLGAPATGRKLLISLPRARAAAADAGAQSSRLSNGRVRRGTQAPLHSVVAAGWISITAALGGAPGSAGAVAVSAPAAMLPKAACTFHCR